uniref:EF-hand domain-containing protein n=1 Tax=Mantoniella antarctica TaxID=81844 RepID=A0A7S0STV0_9CHLO|mmetsp:Transcript_36178/g.90316  ORF Transcript_36178/g.90316 Transcript_36178/m.90316 type:complete len:1661 (+) Transcript_36178:240-5222(+)
MQTEDDPRGPAALAGGGQLSDSTGAAAIDSTLLQDPPVVSPYEQTLARIAAKNADRTSADQSTDGLHELARRPKFRVPPIEATAAAATAPRTSTATANTRSPKVWRVSMGTSPQVAEERILKQPLPESANLPVSPNTLAHQRSRSLGAALSATPSTSEYVAALKSNRSMHSMRAAEVAAAAQLARDLSAVVAGAAPIPHLPFSSVAPAANQADPTSTKGRFDDGDHHQLLPGARKAQSFGGIFEWLFGGKGKLDNGFGHSTPRDTYIGSGMNAVVPAINTGRQLFPEYGHHHSSSGMSSPSSPAAETPGGSCGHTRNMKRKEKLEMAMGGGMGHRHRSGSYKYKVPFGETKAGRASRSTVRLLVFAFLLGSIAGIYLLCAWVLGNYEVSRTFDGAATMVVIVSGCDVVVQGGTEARVTVHGLLTGISSVEWFLPASQQVSVVGADDCTDEIMMRCHDLCRVVVECPPGTAHIRVQQSAEDSALAPLVTVTGDVDVGLVEVRGAVSWATAGPTLGVEFQSGAKITEAIAYTSAGHIVANGVNFGKANFWSISGSVIVTATALESDGAVVNFRQPEGKTCVAVVGAANITASAPWELGSPVNDPSSAARVMATFDVDNNLQVDTTEFVNAIATLNKCCGSGCPLYTFCNPLRFETFNQITSVDDQETVSLLGELAFLQRIVDLNYTWAVPRHDTMVTASFSPAALSSKSFTLRSEAGEVRFTAAPGDAAAAVAAVVGDLSDTVVAQTYVPGGRQSGVRLNKKGADALRGQLYDAFVATTIDVLAIIQVEGSPGVPASRWMYSNREFFIDMEPALMELVSAGVNVPTLLRFQVRMASDDCAASGAVSDDNATLAGEVYRQLRYTLVERGSTTLRGTLIQISPDHKAPYESKRFYSFTYDSTDDIWVQRTFIGRHTKVILASIILSYISSLILALVSLFYFNRFATQKMKTLFTQEFVKKQLNMSRLRAQEIDHAKKVGRVLAEQVTLARSLVANNKAAYAVRLESASPFQSPLVLTRKLIIEPIRRQYINSAKMFMAENYTLHSRFSLDFNRIGSTSRQTSVPLMSNGSRVSRPVPACLLADVYAQFQWYCMQQDLSAMPRTEFLRFLIAKCELRVKTIWFERIQGLLWLREPEKPSKPLLPGSSRDEVTRAFFETYTNFTGNPKSDLVDLTAYPNTAMEDRKEVLLHRLRTFCEESGCEVPEDWADTTTGSPQLCHDIVRMFPELSVVRIQLREIVGLEPRQAKRGSGDGAESKQVLLRDADGRSWFGSQRISHQFVVIEALTVLAHVAIMFLAPCVALWHVMRIQEVYAVTTAMGNPLRGTHLLQLPFLIQGKQVMPMVTTFAWFQVAFMCVCFLRIFLHYLDIQEDSAVRRYLYKMFAVFIYLYLLVMTTYVSVVAMWLLLASVLRPTSLMPYGCALVSLFVLPLYMSRRMSKAASAVRLSLRDFLDARVIDSVKSAMTLRRETAKIDGAGDGDGDDARASEASTQLISQAIVNGKVTAADIFSAVDTDNSDDITMEELADYMKQMDINMSSMRLERLFAYCDTDGSGNISQMEFEQGWEYIMDEMSNDLLESMGLSPNHQMVTIITLFTVALLVICFLFLAIYSYNNEDSFASSVQSILVVASSTLVTNAKKTINEDPKTLNKKINQFIHDDAGDNNEE